MNQIGGLLKHQMGDGVRDQDNLICPRIPWQWRVILRTLIKIDRALLITKIRLKNANDYGSWMDVCL